MHRERLPFDSHALRLLEASRAKRRGVEATLAQKEKEQEQEQEERRRQPGKQEQEEAFESMYMRAVVGEYAEELDAIRRKEPGLGDADDGGRMGLLIDALKAGSELFSRSDPDEVALVMGGRL